MKLLIKWIVCFLTLLCASEIFPAHVIVRHGIITLVVAATILWLVNIIIRPVVQVVSLPLTLITFGIFSLVVNAAMVGLTGIIVVGFSVKGFLYCLLIAVIISIASTALAPKKKDSK